MKVSNIFFFIVILFSLYTMTTATTEETKESKATCDSPKSGLTVLLLSIFLGGIGVDRFYTGYILFGS